MPQPISRPSPSIPAKAASCRSRAVMPNCWRAGSRCCSKAASRRMQTIQSALAPSSFAGICLTLLPWLLCGGTLVLHHPFDLPTLAQQMRDEQCDGAHRARRRSLSRWRRQACSPIAGPASIIAAWRAPERLATSPAWRVSGVALIDVAIFGEAALAPARRRRRTAGRAQCRSARCWRRVTPPTELSSPNSAAPRPARSPCAGPWCRTMPSRPASKAPACPISRSGARAGRYRLHLPLRCRQTGVGRDWPASRNYQRRGLSFSAAGSARGSSAASMPARSLARCRMRSSASGSSARRPTAPPCKRRSMPPASIR